MRVEMVRMMLDASHEEPCPYRVKKLGRQIGEDGCGRRESRQCGQRILQLSRRASDFEREALVIFP